MRSLEDWTFNYVEDIPNFEIHAEPFVKNGSGTSGQNVQSDTYHQKEGFLAFCKSRRSKNWRFQKLRNLNVFNLNNR